jgi:hypothetical protein
MLETSLSSDIVFPKKTVFMKTTKKFYLTLLNPNHQTDKITITNKQGKEITTVVVEII